ncbi:Glycine-, glutamate-, thienylcyclohexylpiperidine-binding protein [Spironucleus salmonicida]|uniref:Glycine-, glutamate-, thienylcyclohexylpiperidine-binding protein n=1 Tax=Spironucleus salmonicida TaxID=348837 RepID=V6LJU3_9EUKA|nr:Glycine-, glutamate-, thienylcyclohexylpiperidine-binding protein [Spironucleus salmonicida]|eukprot:EST44870.1 Glycine-, glutamate-, thienylcyclohexylpiperidine-binding protein [Spironucleus salmonicida]
MADSQLQLKVLQASSFEQNYAPDAVLAANPLSDGWRTAPNAAAPHFLTLALANGPAEVSSIQFVAHEALTPLTVEVYVLPPQEATWQRLGHVRMAENSNGRQRKTFKVKIRAAQIRFQMTEIVQNAENNYSQISLTSVLIKGEQVSEIRPGSAQMSAFKDKFVPEAVKQQIGHNQVYNEIVIKIIQQLNMNESLAVEKDEYLEAERMSVACKKVQEFGKALDQLEIKKAAAVKRKDYKAAQEIKENIDQIKEIITMDLDDMISTLNGEQLKKKVVAKANFQTEKANFQPQKANFQQIPQIPQIQQTRENEIPETTTNHNEEKPLAGQQQNAQFALSEEEKAEIEEERKRRSEEMKQERLRKATKGGKAQIPDLEPQNAVAQNLGKSRSEHFQTTPFHFIQALEQLSQYWEKSEQAPAQIPPQQTHSDPVQVLRVLNFSEIFIRLAASKSLEHVSDAVLFAKCAAQGDLVAYCEGCAAVCEIVAENANLSLLNHANQLFAFAYVGFMQKFGRFERFQLEPIFLNVDDELSKQKENAVIYANLGVKNTGSDDLNSIQNQLFAPLGQNVQFANSILKLISTPISRLQEKQKRTKLQALNITATLASFPAFPERQFLAFLISKTQIDKASNLKSTEQNLLNKQYLSLYEARTQALYAVISVQNALISKNSAPILLDFLKFSLPNANKKEVKDAVLGVLGLMYGADDVFTPLQILNAISENLKNEPLKKQIAGIFSACDAQRGGTPRIVYLAESQKLIVNINIQQQQQQVPSNMCQFCLFQCKTSNILEMHKHLLLECPCCGICPGCHQLIEIPCLPDHLLHSCSNSEQFNVLECKKCLCAVDKTQLSEHLKECQFALKGEESVCPLCGAVLKDGEDALVHYSDGGCNANPRTSADLQGVIRQKMERG